MLLASTADNFFVVELQTLSSILKLSDDVAGVTLLALGNGAPDIFTAVVGLGQNDFQLALSDLMGGGIFINTVVLGSVLLVTDPATLAVDRKPFLRDLGMYMLCTLAVFFVAVDGKVDMFEALMFLVGYLLYIVFVLVTATPTLDDADEYDEIASVLSHSEPLVPSDSRDLSVTKPPSCDDHTGMRDSFRQYSTASHFVHHAAAIEAEDSRLLGFNDYPDLAIDGKLAFFLWWVEFPLSLLRHLSIPAADPFWDQNRRVLSALSPILASQLIVLVVKGADGFTLEVEYLRLPLGVLALIVGTMVSVTLFFCSNATAQPRYFNVSVLFAFLMSVVWLDLIANEIVAMLETIGLLLGVSTSILGLTVLAWGNSVGDLVADTATAKAGKVKTAIASCFGSPLLSALVGLGIALTVTTSKENGSFATSIDTQNLAGMITLLFTLGCSGVVFVKYDYKPPREYAYFLFILYFLFIVTSCLLEVFDL